MKLSLATLALALAGSALTGAALACNQTKGDAAATTQAADAAPPAEVTADGKRVPIEANAKGFTPSSVTVTKGERTTLVFKRTSDETCATEVVFPELKIEKKLPLNQAVAFEVPTDQTRTLTFQCGMGMYKSKIVVQLVWAPPRPFARAPPALLQRPFRTAPPGSDAKRGVSAPADAPRPAGR